MPASSRRGLAWSGQGGWNAASAVFGTYIIEISSFRKSADIGKH